MRTANPASYKLIERPIYGSSRVGIDNTPLELIGYTAPTSGILTHELGLKQYELVNHLGNVLRCVEPVETTTVSDKKIPVDIDNDGIIDYYVADITSATDYYPFGSPMDGRAFSGEKYRFGFGGKENDNEVKGDGNQQDYGLRIYDTRLGRFLSVDPLTASYPWYTPYQFAGNMPIKFIDLDGGEPKDPGCEGDVQDAYMTGPNEKGEFDSYYHSWRYSNGTWVNEALTLDPKLESVEKPAIIFRSVWGAQSPNDNSSYTQVDPTVFYQFIIIHHSGNTNSPSVEEVQQEHIDRGFNDIGYHYAIDLNGNIFEGRPLWKQGAGVEGVDQFGVLNIVILGDMQNSGLLEWSNDELTTECTEAVIKLTNYLSIKYGINFTGGHCEIYTNHTLCPGNQVMDIMPTIRERTNTSPPPTIRSDNWFNNFFKWF